MQKKLLIPILVVLVLVIVLMVRGCGNKDASQGDKQDETQDVQTDTFDNTNTTGNDVRTELGTMTANESGGVDITVTADGLQTTYTYTDVAPDAWYADAVNYVVSTGVMSGDDTQHLFQPEYGVERSQFAVIVYRFAGGTPTEEDAEFSDLAGDEWYYEYVKWMVGKGLEAFGLMVLPYAISVLCTAIGIVPLMVFLAFGRENKKQRMVRVLSSWLSIVLLNGVATAVYNLTGLENLYLYTALATAGITYVLVKNLVVSVQRQKRQMSVVLYNKTVSVPCIGLLDSGNLLTMPLSGNPVHIADAALLQKLVDEKTVQKEIPYRALGNPHGKLQVYCMDGMKVETEPAKFCDWKQVWVGCAENGVLCNKPYQLILHASVADHCGCTKDPSQMTKKLRKEKRNVFTV